MAAATNNFIRKPSTSTTLPVSLFYNAAKAAQAELRKLYEKRSTGTRPTLALFSALKEHGQPDSSHSGKLLLLSKISLID